MSISFNFGNIESVSFSKTPDNKYTNICLAVSQGRKDAIVERYPSQSVYLRVATDIFDQIMGNDPFTPEKFVQIVKLTDNWDEVQAHLAQYPNPTLEEILVRFSNIW